ncbi:MAG: hypothetical protein ABJE95_13435 [Byssovorax sp.]
MISEPKRMGAAEAALRLMARRGRGDWMAVVVEPGVDAQTVAEELAREMEAIGDVTVERVLGARDPEDLSTRLASATGPVVSAGLDDWPAEEWANLDRLRSRYAREERTALVLCRAAFDNLLQEAPNFSSWLGASVVMYQPNASYLDEEGRQRRLATLRAWSGLTDEETITRAAAGTLPAEPEFAEWLVLLGRGDLLER